MASAPFVWRRDGRPDWGAMWTTFCDLALHGGPPQRGALQALRGPSVDDRAARSAPEIAAELRRGIEETTGLGVEAAEPGWIAITCACASGAPFAMQTHLGAALRSGDISLAELQEFVIMFAAYAGHPAATAARAALDAANAPPKS